MTTYDIRDIVAALERIAAAEEHRNELIEADQAFRREVTAEADRVMTERWEAISGTLDDRRTAP